MTTTATMTAITTTVKISPSHPLPFIASSLGQPNCVKRSPRAELELVTSPVREYRCHGDRGSAIPAACGGVSIEATGPDPQSLFRAALQHQHPRGHQPHECAA